MSNLISDTDAPRLGVLGGMGPMASAWFMVRLTALTPAARDQDHIPTILWSDPRVPDRSAGHAGTGPDPWPWLRDGVSHLTAAGASVIAIPCNTAHLWYEELCRASAVPILDIRQAVLAGLRSGGIAHGCIGVLGTTSTMTSGLYQNLLRAAGYDCVELEIDEHRMYSESSIALVKANQLERAFAPAAKAVERLRARGVDGVVLGCTELPLALPLARRPALGVPVVDSIDALAHAAIAWYREATSLTG